MAKIQFQFRVSQKKHIVPAVFSKAHCYALKSLAVFALILSIQKSFNLKVFSRLFDFQQSKLKAFKFKA